MEETGNVETTQQSLDKLIRLQDLQNRLAQLRGRIGAAPGQIEHLSQRQEDEKSRVAAAEQSLEQSARERRRLEGEVDSQRAKLSHLKGQLMEVKTNEAYHAMLKEIAYAEGQIRAKEDEILEHMVYCEELERALKDEHAAFLERCRQLEADKVQLAAFLREAELETARLEVELREIESVIEPGYLERFRRISAARGGVALATISNGSCEACHVRLRPQLIAEVKSHREIIQCENCNRILYYVPVPAAPNA